MATVCLDPGHGGRDPGAVRGELKEKALTLAIAQSARAALGSRYRVVLTRAADLTLSLADRRAVAERARAELFVSIHVNVSSTPPRAAGVEALVGRPAHPDSVVLAGAILRAITARFPQQANRGVRQRALGVLRQMRRAGHPGRMLLPLQSYRAGTPGQALGADRPRPSHRRGMRNSSRPSSAQRPAARRPRNSR